MSEAKACDEAIRLLREAVQWLYSGTIGDRIESFLRAHDSEETTLGGRQDAPGRAESGPSSADENNRPATAARPSDAAATGDTPSDPAAVPASSVAQPELAAGRCTICRGMRIPQGDGTYGACSFLDCPDPMADYRREHPEPGGIPSGGFSTSDKPFAAIIAGGAKPEGRPAAEPWRRCDKANCCLQDGHLGYCVPTLPIPEGHPLAAAQPELAAGREAAVKRIDRLEAGGVAVGAGGGVEPEPAGRSEDEAERLFGSLCVTAGCNHCRATIADALAAAERRGMERAADLIDKWGCDTRDKRNATQVIRDALGRRAGEGVVSS